MINYYKTIICKLQSIYTSWKILLAQHLVYREKFFLRIVQCVHRGVARSSLLEVFCKKRCSWPANLFKKRLWHRCFPVNFAKFLRTAFLPEHLRWLLLCMQPGSPANICDEEICNRSFTGFLGSPLLDTCDFASSRDFKTNLILSNMCL